MMGRTARVARALVPAAPALVRALVLRRVDKRRDESRRGRHKCPRHPVIHNLSNGLWRNFFGTAGGFSMVQPAFQPASCRSELKLTVVKNLKNRLLGGTAHAEQKLGGRAEAPPHKLR